MNAVQMAIIIFYVLVILFTGLYSNFRKKNNEIFLISGRALQGTSDGYSIAASKIGGGLLITYSTMFFVYGVQAFWVFIGYVIGYFVFYSFARKIHQESKEYNYYTMADYFHRHYGKVAGIAVGILCTLSVGGWILTNLIAGGMLLSNISGWSTTFTTSLLAVTITIYLINGGFNSVVKTDVIQFFSLIIIGAIITVALYQVDGNTSANTVSIWGNESLPVGKIIFFVLIGLLFPMGSAELWQRVYAAETTREYFKASVVASASFFVLGVLLSFICYKLMSMDNLQQISPDLMLVRGVAEIMESIHPAFTALWFLVFFSAILSSADTFIYTTASSLVQDIFLRMGWVQEKDVVKWIRVSIAVLAILGVAGSIVFQDIVSVTFYFLGLTLMLSTIVYVAWITGKLTNRVLLLSIAAGFIVSTYYAVFQGISLTTSMLAFIASLSVFLIQLIITYGMKVFSSGR